MQKQENLMTRDILNGALLVLSVFLIFSFFLSLNEAFPSHNLSVSYLLINNFLINYFYFSLFALVCLAFFLARSFYSRNQTKKLVFYFAILGIITSLGYLLASYAMGLNLLLAATLALIYPLMWSIVALLALWLFSQLNTIAIRNASHITTVVLTSIVLIVSIANGLDAQKSRTLSSFDDVSQFIPTYDHLTTEQKLDAVESLSDDVFCAGYISPAKHSFCKKSFDNLISTTRYRIFSAPPTVESRLSTSASVCERARGDKSVGGYATDDIGIVGECHRKMAKRVEDCELIPAIATFPGRWSSNIRHVCYLDFAIKNSDRTICEKMVDTEERIQWCEQLNPGNTSCRSDRTYDRTKCYLEFK